VPGRSTPPQDALPSDNARRDTARRAAATAGVEGSKKEPLDINNASADELTALKGIGEADAKRIVGRLIQVGRFT
jgi:DNA uptake protein ComE-like DNA-binding protein